MDTNTVRHISSVVTCSECDDMYEAPRTMYPAELTLPCGHRASRIIFGGQGINWDSGRALLLDDARELLIRTLNECALINHGNMSLFSDIKQFFGMSEGEIMSKTLKHYEHVLRHAGLFDEDSDYDGMLGTALLELMEVFLKQGHSGFSASRVADIFKKLVLGEPLVPLKGTPDEWVKLQQEDFSLYMNIYCPDVFADDDNGLNATYSRGRVFIDKDGLSFTGQHSYTPVHFPCIPETIFIREGTPEANSFTVQYGVNPFA